MGLKHKVVEGNKKEKAGPCIDGLHAEWRRCGQEEGRVVNKSSTYRWALGN